jgi:hypothetical protein
LYINLRQGALFSKKNKAHVGILTLGRLNYFIKEQDSKVLSPKLLKLLKVLKRLKDISTPDFSTMNFSSLDFSTLNF